MQDCKPRPGRRLSATLLALCLLLPLIAAASAPRPAFAAGQGGLANMSTRKKAVLLGGAALLYYLYRRHQASNAPNAQNARQTAAAGAARRTPQLYRSKNGGIYYRDAAGKPVWLTVPQQGMQVPAEDLQRYAPDYNQYRGPAPTAPSGYRSQSFGEFNPNLAAPGPAGPAGAYR